MAKSTRGKPSPVCLVKVSQLMPRKGPGSPQSMLKKSVQLVPKAAGAAATTKSMVKTTSEKTAPRAVPINRGSYEALGTGDTQPKSGRAVPANRPSYEMVGQPSEKPGTVMIAGGPVLNRPSYEMIKPDEASGRLADMVAGAGDVHLPEFLAPENEPSDVLSIRRPSRRRTGSPESLGRKARRKAAAEAAKREENRPFRMAMWILVAVLAVLLIGTIISFGIHWGMPKPTESPKAQQVVSGPTKASPDAKHFRDAAGCLTLASVPTSCIFGSAPDFRGRCGRGQCYTMKYEMIQDKHDVFNPPEPRQLDDNKTTNAKIFCLAAASDRPPDARVCVDQLCSHRYNGTAGIYNVEQYKGVWRDSCDKPNECWVEPSGSYNVSKETIFSDPSLIDRAGCLKASRGDCPSDNVTAAIVWLQHLTCSINPSFAGSPCHGLPIQLWNCSSCRLPGDHFTLANEYASRSCSPGESSKSMSNGCAIKCGSGSDQNTTYRRLPNGAACGNSNSSYCFQGACLPSKEKSNDPLTKAQCDNEAKALEAYWKNFKLSERKPKVS